MGFGGAVSEFEESDGNEVQSSPCRMEVQSAFLERVHYCHSGRNA